MLAAKNDKGEVLRLLLSHNLDDINQCDPTHGRTPLLWAAYFGDEETIRCLLSDGRLDRYRTDHEGCTSLWLAASRGHFSVVQMLLGDKAERSKSRSAWLNAGELRRNCSPLQKAVGLGHFVSLNAIVFNSLITLYIVICVASASPRAHWLGLH